VRALIDTHTLLWWVTDDPKLSRKVRAILAALDSEILVSAASAWEIATKVRLGKLPGAEALAAEFDARLKILGFHPMPITVEHAQRAGLLPGTHKDPFDRMLIAQAQTENLPILSNDAVFDEFHIRRIW
jgi:PIN domain nuclease of toxin-antitoxin system